MIKDFNFKSSYNIDDLLEIMKILRSPDGCPWDREQTHASIKKDCIEETYEVVEAINKDDKTLLCEELGDLLLQIVFHAQIENEQGVFGFNEITDGICKKLIERHPHVFGEVSVKNSAEVLKNWDEIKNNSKNRKTVTSTMQSIPRELPALMRSQKIQHKAHKAGFDWQNVTGALDKLQEEIAELNEAISENSSEKCFDELGDVLFSAVNVSRFVGCDAEEALTASADKFLNRFEKVEIMAQERNIDMKNTPLDELDKLWDEAKLK